MQQISQMTQMAPMMFDYNNLMGMNIGIQPPYDINQLNQMIMTGQLDNNPMMMGMGLNNLEPQTQNPIKNDNTISNTNLP